MELQPSYGRDHPGLSQCHPDRENPKCGLCVHFNQLVDLPALLPHSPPAWTCCSSEEPGPPPLTSATDMCSLAGRPHPSQMTWLWSSCPVDHKRDYGLPEHTHFSNQEAEATMQQGISFTSPEPDLWPAQAVSPDAWEGSSG